MVNSYIETYKSIKIYHSPEDGFFGCNGPDDFGYSDTIEEIREEIDCYWQETQHGPLNGMFF